MKMKITFWFRVIVASFILATTLFIVEEIFSTSEYSIPFWCLGILPAFTIIGIVFWLRSNYKSSVLLDLFSIAILVIGYCFTTGIAQILAGTIVGFFRSVPIRAAIYELSIGIIEEFQTLFFIIFAQLGKMNSPEGGFKFMWPYTLLSVVFGFLVLRTFWDSLKLFKKSANERSN